MKKRNSFMRKAPSEASRLQQERKEIEARLKSKLVWLSDQDRQAAGLRLIEVKRALNRIYSAGL